MLGNNIIKNNNYNQKNPYQNLTRRDRNTWKTINENEAKLDISGQIVKFLLKVVLLGVVGIIVRLRSGGQLAMTLVVSISIFIPPPLF